MKHIHLIFAMACVIPLIVVSQSLTNLGAESPAAEPVTPSSKTEQTSTSMTQNTVLSTAVFSVAGVIVAAIISQILIHIFTNRRNQRLRELETSGIMSALRAEIRYFKKQLNSRMDWLFGKKIDPKQLKGVLIGIADLKESEIFEAYKDKIGSLGPIYNDWIVAFYSHLINIRQNINLILVLYPENNIPEDSLLKLKNLFNIGLKRAKILDSILTESMRQGIFSIDKQLEMEAQATEKEES